MRKLILRLFTMTLMGIVTACQQTPQHRTPATRGADYEQQLVISEVASHNRTGLTDHNGQPTDWLEIHNTTSAPVSLAGYLLWYQDADLQDSAEWALPDTTLQAGAYLVVKTSSNADGKHPLEAPLPLSKQGGTLQLITPANTIASQVDFPALTADASYQRIHDSTFVTTLYPSPLQPNTPEGYVAATQAIDSQRRSAVVIWEAMSRGKKSRDNWVEVRNVSSQPVSLRDYALAPKVGAKRSWQFPDVTLRPGQVYQVQTAGKKAKSSAHVANIKMSDEETIVLLHKDRFADGICARATTEGTSIGRRSGETGLFYFASPTPGHDNSTKAARHIAEGPAFDLPSGTYDGKRLTIRLADPTQRVHYTLDGTLPTSDSPLLRASLRLDSSAVVRTYAEGNDHMLRSRVTTHTYILGRHHTLPIISVAIPPRDLWDSKTGMYVKGPDYDREWPHKKANYWKRLRRRAHVEMIDSLGGFETDADLSIFGGYSRAEDKKSFALRLRNNYGQKAITYDFFATGQPVELKKMVLRSGSQDWNRCMLRDEFFSSLMQPECPSLLIQGYRPVVLYINARYFGLYYIREKIDRDFVNRHLGLKSDSIDIIMSLYKEEGSRRGYDDLIHYLTHHDMSRPEHYRYAEEHIDLEGLIDWKLGEIYSGNTDVGNIRYVYSHDKKSDHRWHFVFYDLDATWSSDEPNVGLHLGASDNKVVSAANVMVRQLMANADFRKRFLERLDYHAAHTFSPERATAHFDQLVATIRPEMKYNCERWPNLKYSTWEKNIARFRERLATRTQLVVEGVKRKVGEKKEKKK